MIPKLIVTCYVSPANLSMRSNKMKRVGLAVSSFSLSSCQKFGVWNLECTFGKDDFLFWSNIIYFFKLRPKGFYFRCAQSVVTSAHNFEMKHIRCVQSPIRFLLAQYTILSIILNMMSPLTMFLFNKTFSEFPLHSTNIKMRNLRSILILARIFAWLCLQNWVSSFHCHSNVI